MKLRLNKIYSIKIVRSLVKLKINWIFYEEWIYWWRRSFSSSSEKRNSVGVFQ